MPLYEYQCQQCEHRFEAMQRVNADPLQVCPQCGGPLEKLISAPAFQFKGSGWYVTDYGGKSAGGPSEGKGEASGESKGEGKAESSAASKGEGKSDSSTSSKGEGKAASPAKT
jgi:putative FmdB family regulatory protein